MASEMQTTENKITKFWPRKNRILQKRLRSCGQEYISRSGKIIPAKSQPDELCQCPQRCDDKVPPKLRAKLFDDFYKIADHSLQNDFLMAHIRTRAVQRRSTELKTPGRNQRRVSCKYQVPIHDETSPPLQPGPSPPGTKLAEICQKAFMNVFAITEKRVRLQREKLIACVLQGRPQSEALSTACQTPPVLPTATTISLPNSTVITIPMMTPMPMTNAIAMTGTHRRQVKIGQIGEVGLWRDEPVVESVKPKTDFEFAAPLPPLPTPTPKDFEFLSPLPFLSPKQIEMLRERHHEIALVDNFFCNQLWKPEYINTPCN